MGADQPAYAVITGTWIAAFHGLCDPVENKAYISAGKIWWFAIEYQRRLYQRSTRLTNKNDAIKAESAFRLALIKGGAGIADRKQLPGFREAMADFLKWSENAHQESSHRRYRVSSVALLHFFKDASLTDVTADEIERFKTARIRQFTTVRAVGKRKQTDQRIKPATVNRELACLPDSRSDKPDQPLMRNGSSLQP